MSEQHPPPTAPMRKQHPPPAVPLADLLADNVRADVELNHLQDQNLPREAVADLETRVQLRQRPDGHHSDN
jgi:hypothetical protein